MRTALASDFHLGASASALPTPPVLDRLLGEVAGTDQLVLLGDVLSLRAAPLAEVLAAARPAIVALGRAMAGRRVVLVPGNHDHLLAQPVLDEFAPGEPLPLDAARAVDPGTPGVPGQLAAWLGDAELVIAYPGIWVRPDVYATHGHYLDCHMTVPRLESLFAAVMQALAGRVPAEGAAPDDYEAVLAPIYAYAHQRAQWGKSADGTLERVSTAGWRRLLVRGESAGFGARAAGALAAAGGVAALNKAGFGPFRPDLSPAAIGKAGIRAMSIVAERLGLEAEHIVFGHTHRLGPLPGDTLYDAPAGPRLANTGAWVYQSILIDEDNPDDPYWPGGCVVVDEVGAPEVRPLLREATAPRAVA